MLRTPSLPMIALLLTLALGACAETATPDEVTSSATLLREYDKTLTKSEQEAIIRELQSAKAKRQ
jgi:hypothetical protein